MIVCSVDVEETSAATELVHLEVREVIVQTGVERSAAIATVVGEIVVAAGVVGAGATTLRAAAGGTSYADRLSGNATAFAAMMPTVMTAVMVVVTAVMATVVTSVVPPVMAAVVSTSMVPTAVTMVAPAVTAAKTAAVTTTVVAAVIRSVHC